jgi:lipocalin
MKQSSLILLALIMSILVCNAQHRDIDRTTVTALDVERYMGVWFEVARYDHSFERGLEQCKALYTLLPDGRIVVENSGVDSHNGKFRLSVGKAKAGDKAGQLRVSFFWFFYSDYNILALGDEYDWALVGSKSAKYLWILSRTPSLAEETLNHILDIATQRGYDTSKLLWVRQ